MKYKNIRFINQRARWKMYFYAAGIFIMILGLVDLLRNNHYSFLMAIAMILLYIPVISPLRFKDYVRFQKHLISFKLGKQKTQIIRPDRIREIELFRDKMIIWTGKKKFSKVNTAGYSNEHIFKLVDLLEGKNTR